MINRKNEIRQRNRDKQDKLSAQVRDIKRRQKESEEWQNIKRSLFNPLTLSLGAAVVGGGFLAFLGYLYMRG